ncbi:hypothetical protein OG373_11075 [Streptomyces avidinii]|uniref:hypothetical protein n=1 Tax=Streptomyces avidinii TaxID=1895 RepID=UPI00386B39A6|nr:hypothetical protein OG373_11075 [Streptomyces avidinii]
MNEEGDHVTVRGADGSSEHDFQRARTQWLGSRVEELAQMMEAAGPDLYVLFASLRLQMLDGADRADRLHRPGGEDARAYKRSWMLGFIREVTARVGLAQQAARTAAEREAEPAVGEEGGRSVALVLADRTSEVDSRLATHYPKLRKPSPTKFKGTGYRQGIADGRNADIGSPAFGEGGWPG